jgi:GNAT superfamily N-acetyltransferase
MTLNDLESGMRLSKAEGWNQTENDWRVFIEGPANVCILAECDNKVIGTTTSINYGNDAAWIGMVLVDKDFRGMGVSKSLLSTIFEKLAAFKSIKLDATAAGQPVYQKFGFKNEYLISRMVNLSVKEVPVQDSDSKLEAMYAEDLRGIIALDERVFGANRKQLIEFLVNEHSGSGVLLRRDGEAVAFALGRKGSRYSQIGPVVASSTADAKNLISKCLIGLANQPAVVDVLWDKSELVDWLISIGFTRQRDFVRMYKGENPSPGKTEKLFLICGPEFG